ncbi:hypothetical protein BUE76_21825 [Cnuella takakiae]|nr:hypothetical protein BUE76_21825 [Cnuella takakiae]
MKAVGQRIRAIRLERNRTQEDLAIDCGVDYSQINRMELGERNFSISFLELVARHLSVDPKELLP